MENKCPDCGCEEIIKGKLVSYGTIVFVPQDEKGFVKKSSYIYALACKRCGTVFSLKLSDKPTKLTER